MNGLTNIINILKNENTVLSHKVKVLADENDILRKKLGMVNNKKFTDNKISSLFIDNEKNHIDNFIDKDSENSEERDFFITLREVKAEMEDKKNKKNKNKKNKNKKSQNK